MNRRINRGPYLRWVSVSLCFITITAVLLPRARACTRVVYLGNGTQVITARSMDWKVDVGTNLWILPRGIARNGEAGANSLKWTSKYGSVIASGYDISTTDGMNEKGLVANLLWLAESEYPEQIPGKPGMALSGGRSTFSTTTRPWPRRSAHSSPSRSPW